jgi:hypothetical protein
MNQGVQTYDPKRVSIALGSHVVSGYAEGSFVTIEPGGDGTSKTVGADGEVVRSIDPDNTSTVTITLLQTSRTVKFAQDQYDRDQANGNGMFPVLVRDNRGGLVFSAAQAWVTNRPSREFAKEAGEREIVIETGVAVWGGNG